MTPERANPVLSGSQGRSLHLESSKLKILEKIKKNRILLLSNKEDEEGRREIVWKKILEECQLLGICSHDRSWTFVRDSLWGNWKNRALKRSKKLKQRGGFQQVSRVDAAVLGILNAVAVDEEYCSRSVRAPKQPKLKNASLLRQNLIPPERPEVKEPSNYRKKKRELRMELLSIEIYHKKLMCFALEKGLKLKCSSITEGLNNQADVSTVSLPNQS